MKEIVSSQLDVDRMDYMIRDQANSGAQIGGFDSARVIRVCVGDDGTIRCNGLACNRSLLSNQVSPLQSSIFHKVNQLTQEYLVREL